MAEVTDLYSVLGVSPRASDEEIRRAYRRLARELHPDVNRDPQAGEKFKQVTAAYEVLSDPAKRQRYDTYGSSAIPDMFPFGDIFEAFFGTGFGRGRTRARATRTRRGGDVTTSISITLEEAVFGMQKDVPIHAMEFCQSCNGTGAETGTAMRRCTRCSGTGEVQDVQRSIFGTIMTARTCPSCEGTGEEFERVCRECGGDGRKTARQAITVDIPPGVSEGTELRVAGVGDVGRHGGGPGDLFLTIRTVPHPVFERRGQDLFALVDVPLTQAVLGAELEVRTLDGNERVKLHPGTQPGTQIRLRGRGVPNLGRRGRGDLVLAVNVHIPEHLHKEERRLLEKLADMRSEAPRKGEQVRASLRRP